MSAAAGAMFLGYGRTVRAQSVSPQPQCTITGATVTCTGDLSGGVAVDGGAGTYDTLNVNTLTTNIDPASGTNGIEFISVGDVTITSDTGSFEIETDLASGVHAYSDGNAVTITHTGNITTTSDGTMGIYAQGIYAFSNGAGKVTVDQTGNINNSGQGGHGIVAFSPTGDVEITQEGDIGVDGNYARAIQASTAGSINITQTGNLSTAGIYGRAIETRSYSDGHVTIMQTGDISTSGYRAAGIFVDSFGGDVEITQIGNIKTNGEQGFGIIAAARYDGSLTVRQTGDITTSGEAATGIFAQTTYGDLTVIQEGDISASGLYSRGIWARSGGKITITQTGNIETMDVEGHGIIAYSFYNSVDVDQTGTVTTHGNDAIGVLGFSEDGVVTVTQTGNIETSGDRARGLQASSLYNTATATQIGDIETDGDESHGILGSSIDGAVDIDQTGNITTSGSYSDGIHGYSSGSADVDVTQTGTITTSGEESHGIYGYSLGDGAIDIDQTGTITTLDEDSHGIYAYSRGGGDVNLTQTGTITTHGDDSHGIYAYSYDGGEVSVTHSGNITTNGSNARGIHVFAYDDTTTTDMGITLSNSTIVSEYSVGIEFSDGGTNTLTVHNTVTVSGGFGDIAGDSGDETINNYGTLTALGIIDLEDGSNAFNNMEGATFNSGSTVYLGDGNLFTNEGDFSPGGTGSVETTVLTGDFVNTGDGSFTFTIDESALVPNDHLDITGMATLDGGTVTVSGSLGYGNTYTILTADNGVIGMFDDVADTLFVDNVLESDANNVYLTSNIVQSFCEFAGTSNQMAVACTGLDSLSVGNEVVQALLALNTAAEAQTAYDALSGEVHASLRGALMDNGQRRVDAINDRLNGGFADDGTVVSVSTFGDPSPLADGKSGFWKTGYGSWGGTDATGNTAELDNDFGGVILGYDRRFGNNWLAGLIAGYGRTDVSQDALLSSADASTWSLGVYAGTQEGAAHFNFGGLYNWHSISSSRTVSFTGFTDTLTASYDARSWQLFGEAGYDVELAGRTFTPFAGISHVGLDTDGFTERGGAAALSASAETQSATYTTLGVRHDFAATSMISINTMFGWRHAFGDTDPAATFTLSGSSPFTVTGAPLAEDALVTELGLEGAVADNVTMGVSYNGQYGDDTAVHGFNARLNMSF